MEFDIFQNEYNVLQEEESNELLSISVLSTTLSKFIPNKQPNNKKTNNLKHRNKNLKDLYAKNPTDLLSPLLVTYFIEPTTPILVSLSQQDMFSLTLTSHFVSHLVREHISQRWWFTLGYIQHGEGHLPFQWYKPSKIRCIQKLLPSFFFHTTLTFQHAYN